MKALIDGDIVTFKAAFTAEEDEVWIAKARTDDLLDTILAETGCETYEIWISGKSNFRYTVFPEYKANRINAKRPKWEAEVKQHLVDHWNANVADGCEADDMLGARQTNDTIICTIDKDLDQIPGLHYNFVKKEKYEISEEDAYRFFCYQLMVGDPSDGIKGVPGIGKVKANKLLESYPSDEWIDRIRNLYSCDEEFDLNAKCLYIWRKDNDNYTAILEKQRSSVTEISARSHS